MRVLTAVLAALGIVSCDKVDEPATKPAFDLSVPIAGMSQEDWDALPLAQRERVKKNEADGYKFVGVLPASEDGKPGPVLMDREVRP